MSKVEKKDENPVAKGKQATTDYKEPANILTDNRKTDYDQSNLNPDSEAVRAGANFDAGGGLVKMGSDGHGVKLPKPFADANDAMKYLGKQVLVTSGESHRTATLHSVNEHGIEAPAGFKYPFSAAYPWDGSKESKAFEDARMKDPAYNVQIELGADDKKAKK